MKHILFVGFLISNTVWAAVLPDCEEARKSSESKLTAHEKMMQEMKELSVDWKKFASDVHEFNSKVESGQVDTVAMQSKNEEFRSREFGLEARLAVLRELEKCINE